MLEEIQKSLFFVLSKLQQIYTKKDHE